MNEFVVTYDLFQQLSKKMAQNQLESYAAAGSVAEEVFSSIRTVVAFDGQEHEMKRFKKHLLNSKQDKVKSCLYDSMTQGLIWFLGYGTCALGYWYGVELFISESHLPDHEKSYTAGNIVSVRLVDLRKNFL